MNYPNTSKELPFGMRSTTRKDIGFLILWDKTTLPSNTKNRHNSGTLLDRTPEQDIGLLHNQSLQVTS